MTDKGKPAVVPSTRLSEVELDEILQRWQRGTPQDLERAAANGDVMRLVLEIRRLRAIDQGTRLALRAALGKVIPEEGLADLHTADLVRCLAKERGRRG